MFGITRKFEVLQLKEMPFRLGFIAMYRNVEFLRDERREHCRSPPSRFLWVPTGFGSHYFVLPVMGAQYHSPS